MTARSPSQRPPPASRTHPPSKPPDAGERHGRLVGKRVVLAVTGSIAAYKAAIVARLLVGEGAEVQPLFTRSATQFVAEATFSGITGKRVLTSLFDSEI